MIASPANQDSYTEIIHYSPGAMSSDASYDKPMRNVKTKSIQLKNTLAERPVSVYTLNGNIDVIKPFSYD